MIEAQPLSHMKIVIPRQDKKNYPPPVPEPNEKNAVKGYNTIDTKHA